MQSFEDRIKYVMGDLLLSYAKSQQQVEELSAEVERLQNEADTDDDKDD